MTLAEVARDKEEKGIKGRVRGQGIRASSLWPNRRQTATST